jgi:hypothetical protein
MKKITPNQEYCITETFIIHNTNEKSISINYKMTSQTLANIISKWAGVPISPETINIVMKDLKIESEEISFGSGVYVFACDVMNLKTTFKNKK